MTKRDDKLGRRLAGIGAASKAKDAPPPKPKAADKRTAPRDKTWKMCRLTFPDGEKMQCVARDLSESGVRIAIEGAIALPARLTFSMPQSGVTKRARVAWQDGAEAGLEFE